MAASAQWTVGWQRNCDGQQWRQWATASVTMGVGNGSGMIAMGDNGGGAIEGGMAVQS
jgi:hypothetical protein